MKELVKELLAIVPEYLEDLVGLISGPKQFVATRISKHHHPLKKSLIFLVNSYLIAFVLLLPLTKSDPWMLFGATAVFTVFYSFAYAAMMHAAWRLVGGVASFRKVLPIYFYYAGVLELLMVLTYLAMMGGMKAADPHTYKEISDALAAGNFLPHLFENQDRLVNSRAIRVGSIIELVGLSGMLAWFIAGWGAFRQLHGVSRLRSVAAALLFILFSIPVTAISTTIAHALSGQTTSDDKSAAPK